MSSSNGAAGGLLVGIIIGIVIAAIFNINTNTIANLFYRIGNLIERAPTPELNNDF